MTVMEMEYADKENGARYSSFGNSFYLNSA